MAAGKFDLKELERRMRGAIDTLKKEFGGLRTGRASVHLLDPVVVNVYGAAHADQPGGDRLDAGRAHHLGAGLGQGPGRAPSRRPSARPTSGSTRSSTARCMRLPIPSLNAERRQELVKVAHKYAEHARVAVRNVRREGMELLKKLDKDGHMSEDEHHKNSAKVQELTDKLIKEIDQALAAKEAEIKQV